MKWVDKQKLCVTYALFCFVLLAELKLHDHVNLYINMFLKRENIWREGKHEKAESIKTYLRVFANK